MARPLAFRFSGGLGHAEAEAQRYYAPVETFGVRFQDMLRQIKSLGFNSIDLWTGHLGWSWATNEHLRQAADILEEEGLLVTSVCGQLGETLDEFETACRLAADLGARLMVTRAASASSARPLPSLLPVLKDYDLRLAVCNRPEDKTPAQQLAAVDLQSEGRVGTSLDTGTYAANGFDPPLVPGELGGTLMHVRLADVRGVGNAENCELGTGIVDYRACLEALAKINYAGPISIANEPPDYDPSAECAAGLRKIQEWLG
jgi:sugar phosphate isomerase/epimerase